MPATVEDLPAEWQEWLKHTFTDHKHSHGHCDKGETPHFVPVNGFGGYYTCDVQLPIPDQDYDNVLSLIDKGWLYSDEISCIATGVTFEILHYPDGSMGFKHPCTVNGRTLMVVAPRMPSGKGRGKWRIDWRRSKYGITLSPSVICEGCGRHGNVSSGKWWPTCPVTYTTPITTGKRSIVEIDLSDPVDEEMLEHYLEMETLDLDDEEADEEAWSWG